MTPQYTTTNVYHKDEFIRKEKLMTFEEYVKYGRMAPGQCLMLGEVKFDRSGAESHIKSEKVWIGDCTPCYRLRNDVDSDWDYTLPIMQKYVLEVHTF